MTTPLPDPSDSENTDENSQDSEVELSEREKITRRILNDFHDLIFHIESHQFNVERSPEYDSRGRPIEPAISVISCQRSRKGTIYQIKVLRDD